MPWVTKVVATALANRAVATAAELALRHEPGFVAVITTRPGPISDGFRKLRWHRPGDVKEAWRNGRRTVLVLRPGRARGLEFDAVVVVEPASFPENVGRAGSLYTSLTRATKDLHVLYSRRAAPTCRWWGGPLRWHARWIA